MVTRLLALVVIPVFGFAALAASTITAQRGNSQRAERVEAEVAKVDALVALVEAIHNEQASSQVIERARDVGLTPAQLGSMLGYHEGEKLGERRGVTDRAFTALDGRRGRDALAALGVLRTRIDRQQVSATEADQVFGTLDDEVTAVLVPLVQNLKGDATRSGDGADLGDALDGVHAATDAFVLGAAQLGDLVDVALATSQQRQSDLVRLGSDSALYREAGNRLTGIGVRSIARAWGRVGANPDVGAFDQTVAVALAGRDLLPSVGSDVLSTLSREVSGGLTRDDLLYALVNTTTRTVKTMAGNLRVDAQRRYRATALAIGALAIVVAAMALWLGRSITRPLRRLAERAQTVTDGRLDLEPLPLTGPDETRIVSGAVNDLVWNLRLLESKSHALANCEFSDPVLSQPLPGRLGRAIQDSVQVLWGSIEERNALQGRLADQATHDSLTGMHNRAAAISALEQALARSRRTGDTVALLYVDLDDFKLANDTHGHEIGDLVLREVGARMERTVRAGDFVARLGGDEFLVVLERVADVTEASRLAQRIIDALTEPIETQELRFNVGASVGIALGLDGNDEALPLLARADMALYRAKQRGRSTVELYDESLQRQLLERADVEHALGETLARGGDELFLLYQPVIDTPTGKITGLEALIRWARPGHGVVPPDAFIPIAEASNLIFDLDMWVLDTASRQLASWACRPGLEDLLIAVNVSGRHLLSQKLFEHVCDALERTGADPTRLVLEVTETVLLHDLPTAASQLDAIRELGIRVAIDDFGTGFTSLAHLHRLPIDTIKIDRSFVNLIGEQRERSVVRMVTELGHQLGARVIGEGVETAEQFQALAELGCDKVQGFLISRPVPIDEFLAWRDAHLEHAVTEAQ